MIPCRRAEDVVDPELVASVGGCLLRPSSDDEDRQLRAWCGGGLIYRVIAHVYAPTDCPALAARVAAVQLLLSDAGCAGASRAGVVGRISAAWLYCGTAAVGGTPPEQLVVLLPRFHAEAPAVLLTRQARLAHEDVWSVAGVRLTSPLRTALDAVRLLTAARASRVLDDLETAFGVTRGQVRDALAEFGRGQRGAASPRELLRE